MSHKKANSETPELDYDILKEGTDSKLQNLAAYFDVLLCVIFYNSFFSNVKVKEFFVKKYNFTINHKKLGLFYLYMVYLTAINGSYLATCIRLEMSSFGSPFFDGDSLKYLQTISAHALIMIFFVVVPVFYGGFANYLLPYHIGSKDVSYPRLNNMGFWIQPFGYILISKIGSIRLDYWFVDIKITFYSNMNKIDVFLRNKYDIYLQKILNSYYNKNFYEFINIMDNTFFFKLNPKFNYFDTDTYSYKILFWDDLKCSSYNFWLFIKDGYTDFRRKRFVVKCSNATQTVAGWTFITPFSSNTNYTGFGVQDMLILGVYAVGISSTISIVNLLSTRRILSMFGIKNRRILLSFISITILLMLRALSLITPILGSAMLMLLCDRHWHTSFFDFSYGGDAIFFQHLFWFFGHPEVYVLIIPAFGVINAVIPDEAFRRVASKHHLIWAIYVMNYMGFIVWGHHMYLVGLDHRSRSLYSTVTIMISLPATIKVLNWTFTIINGYIKSNLILFIVFSFVMFFLVAGFTGMWLSHVSLNISMHDTLYVVAHFHLMLSGAVLMGIFLGFYFYYWVFFFIKFSKNSSFLHIWYYTLGQWLTFIPMFWLAYAGLPRRLHDFPAMYVGWQAMSTAGHFVTMVGVFYFYYTFFSSNVEKKLAIIIIKKRFNKKKIIVL